MTLEEEVVALRAENAALREQVVALEGQVAELQQRIEELQQKGRGTPRFVKANRPKVTGAKAPRRKRKAEHNRGRRRGKPTKMVVHELEHCPDCGCKLYQRKVARRREVIDLPPVPMVEVTEHRVVKRYCPRCERWRAPRVNLRGQVLGQGRMGVRLVSMIAYLRASLRLPYRAIQEYLETVHGVQVSVGEIVEVLHRLRREVEPTLEQLREQMRGSTTLHMDETGWREDGQNGYVWVGSTPGAEGVCYYEYHRSRGRQVVQRLLGAQFAGVLHSDFYGAYNVYLGAHQRCWVHLLRDLHQLREEHGADEAVVNWANSVKALYEEGQEYAVEGRLSKPEERERKYTELLDRLQPLGLAYAQVKGHPCQALAKRLLRHQDELFLFVLIDGLAADNNLAERSLRPLVVARKISGGTRSPEGSKTRMALASLFQTWRARALNPFMQCLAVLAQGP
jgi:transposase